MPPRKSKYPGVEEHRGKLRIWFFYKSRRIKEPLGLSASEPNRKYAARIRHEVVHKISLNAFNWKEYFPNSQHVKYYGGLLESPLLIEDLLDTWFETYSPTWKASTKKENQKSKLILQREFGSIAVINFKRKIANEFARKQKFSAKRLGNLMSPLRQALEIAVDDELIESNQLLGWSYKIKSAPRKKPPVDPFTSDEQKAILNALEPQARNLVQFWLWTGLRTSELIALNWEDVDFLNGWVSINKALTQASDKFEEPKTSAGERFVKLLEPALFALDNQKQFTALKGQEIFQNPRTADRWTGDAPLRNTLWKPSLRKAKVRYRKPYQCRHTYASMMLQSGENVMWVAKQLGHASWIQTAKNYARYIETGDSTEGSVAVKKFGAYVPKVSPLAVKPA